MQKTPKIAVIIPCYKVERHIAGVISSIPEIVDHIIIVDDACPENSGNKALEVADKRLILLENSENMGVGGAVVAGYKKALELGSDICIKIDGDGQMDTSLIPKIIQPIIEGRADYTKGNRFFFPKFLRVMPFGRMLANLVLSFVTKLSSGYWNVIDPTNGYTAIHRTALISLNLDKISKRYFFESDLLYHLNIRRAVVVDIPMKPIYGDEKSNLEFYKNALPFAKGNICNFVKRIIYTYFIHNFNIASFYLLFGLVFTVFGFSYGVYHWLESVELGRVASAGTVMLAGLPFIIGFQLLLNFIGYDIANTPKKPLQTSINEDDAKDLREF